MQVESWASRFEVVAAKLRPPEPRPGCVSRSGLVNRLRAHPTRIATVVAPAGYGKSTLLAQWAQRDGRGFAWVTVDRRDDDPLVLLRHVAAALDGLEPLPARVLDALASARGSVWAKAVPRLSAAIDSDERAPFVLVLDDADLLRPGDSVDALAVLADHVPDGSTLVVAGRIAPHLPIAALRAGGRLMELGAADLALSRREAELLLRDAGVHLAADDAAAILDRAEGWAAGLYLAALAARDGASTGWAPAYLADYFRSECLRGLAAKRLAFLRRTSVLAGVTGPLCDAVLETTGSALELERIEAAGLFLVPLDRGDEWRRYHPLFRDLLLRELEQHEPGASELLHRRAADWFEAHGEPLPAIDHAAAAGDVDRVARLVGVVGLSVHDNGHTERLERWLELLGTDGHLKHDADVAALAVWIRALDGRVAEARELLAAVDESSRQPCLGVVRAALCDNGAERMLADATAALDGLVPSSPWRPTARLLQGIASALLGEDERADAAFDDAAETARVLGAATVRVAALGERALIAAARDDHAAADALAFEARRMAADAELDDRASFLPAHMAAARALLRQGRRDDAFLELAAAERLIPAVEGAPAWLAARARLELALARFALRDVLGACALLDDVRRILRKHPGLGVLRRQARELEQRLVAAGETAPDGGSGLTGAELRLLPLLATHMSFREIGERLHVSRNTVKTQAISVYRKLGASSRSEAIHEAAQLGLVDLPEALRLDDATAERDEPRLSTPRSGNVQQVDGSADEGGRTCRHHSSTGLPDTRSIRRSRTS